MIVDSQAVYVLTQQIRVEFKKNPLDGSVYFMASDDAELKSLFNLYLDGKEDTRIVEQLPAGVFDGKFEISYTGFSAPDGKDVSALFPEIPWFQSQATA